MKGKNCWNAFKFLAFLVLTFICSLMFMPPMNQNIETIHLHTQDGDAFISFDAYDIPSISGTTKTAIIYALGYVHAKDRLWQMHFMRIFASGRLSEVRTIETLLDFWNKNARLR